MKRKYGFTLVELLIVLAVIAALIATITPLALNAIRRARATQITQNLRTLANAIENAILIDGVVRETEGDDAGDLLGARLRAGSDDLVELRNLARDIDNTRYSILLAEGDDPGQFFVWVFTIAEADPATVRDIWENVKYRADSDWGGEDGPDYENDPDDFDVVVEIDGEIDIDNATFVYEFSFVVYN